MLQNLVTIGSMEGRSPTGYRVPAFFSRILHVLPHCIPAFSTPHFTRIQSRTPAFYQHPITDQLSDQLSQFNLPKYTLQDWNNLKQW